MVANGEIEVPINLRFANTMQYKRIVRVRRRHKPQASLRKPVPFWD